MANSLLARDRRSLVEHLNRLGKWLFVMGDDDTETPAVKVDLQALDDAVTVEEIVASTTHDLSSVDTRSLTDNQVERDS